MKAYSIRRRPPEPFIPLPPQSVLQITNGSERVAASLEQYDGCVRKTPSRLHQKYKQTLPTKQIIRPLRYYSRLFSPWMDILDLPTTATTVTTTEGQCGSWKTLPYHRSGSRLYLVADWKVMMEELLLRVSFVFLSKLFAILYSFLLSSFIIIIIFFLHPLPTHKIVCKSGEGLGVYSNSPKLVATDAKKLVDCYASPPVTINRRGLVFLSSLYFRFSFFYYYSFFTRYFILISFQSIFFLS